MKVMIFKCYFFLTRKSCNHDSKEYSEGIANQMDKHDWDQNKGEVCLVRLLRIIIRMCYLEKYHNIQYY